MPEELSVSQQKDKSVEKELNVSQEEQENDFDYEKLSDRPKFQMGFDKGDIENFGLGGAFMLGFMDSAGNWAADNATWLMSRPYERRLAKQTLADRAAERAQQKTAARAQETDKAEVAALRKELDAMKKAMNVPAPKEDAQKDGPAAQESKKSGKTSTKDVPEAAKAAEAGKKRSAESVKQDETAKKGVSKKQDDLKRRAKTATQTAQGKGKGKGKAPQAQTAQRKAQTQGRG